MSLLTICKRVFAATGWPVLNAIASNSDATAQQIFHLANVELNALSKKLKWPMLQVEYNFNTVNAQAVYPWPEDFRVAEADAIFSTDEYYRLKGSTNMQYWQLYKYGKLGSLDRKRFLQTYIAASNDAPAVELTPVPTGIEPLTSVYYSKLFARDATGEQIPEYIQDTDVSRVPEELVQMGIMWRFRRAKGLDFSAELSEYNTTVLQTFAQYKPVGEVPVGGRRPSDWDGLTQGYVREEGYGS